MTISLNKDAQKNKLMGSQRADSLLMLEAQESKEMLDFGEGFFDLKVRAVLELVNEDASGKSSSTATINGGTKAQRINVSALLPFKNRSALTKLAKAVRATKKDGSRESYIITEETADALDIREVIFDDRLEVNKAEKLQAWNIGFTLKESQSVSELAEQRAATGNFVGGGVVGSDVEDEAEGSLKLEGRLAAMLKKVDTYLGEKFGNENTDAS